MGQVSEHFREDLRRIPHQPWRTLFPIGLPIVVGLGTEGHPIAIAMAVVVVVCEYLCRCYIQR